MTRVRYDPDRLRMDVRGHALQDEAGKDIVCAGISALIFALLNAATDSPDYTTHYYVNRREAHITIQCYVDEQHEAACREMFRTVLYGLALIQKEHPDYLDITGGIETDG